MDAMEILKSVLNGTVQPSAAVKIMGEAMEEVSLLSSVLPLSRTISALKENKHIDFCSHLRQSLVYFPGDYEISNSIYSIVYEQKERFGFTLFSINNKNYINVDSRIASCCPDLESSFSLEKRRISSPSLGDGSLYRCFGYSNYLSLAQKLLLYKISCMEKNETLLAVLPTGGGKSLSWELPKLSGHENRMVVVVVPTNALAADHEKSTRKAFEDFYDQDPPCAYHGDLTDIEKESIIEKIEIGQVSILYISPEALLSNRFKSTIEKAAENDLISMLVVDEAHLICQWGGHFRPEFQLLAAFRNNLQRKSPSGIHTLLLTATLNEFESDMLRTLFTPSNGEGVLNEYRADALRPELSYFLHKCVSENERQELIGVLVDQAPKPLIIYASTKDQVSQYTKIIQERGFRNVEPFTGDTDRLERERIIDGWRDNTIDIIVATSAFGMGVDKADVRTVISPYIPENVSRFYQEVGRAGRDGYAALNYWLPCEDDYDIAAGLTKSDVATIELIAERWNALITAQSVERVSSDTIWVDINSKPVRLHHSDTGERHRGWNKTVINFFLRIGLIEVIDIDYKDRQNYRLLLRLKDTGLLGNSRRIISELSEERDKERDKISLDFSHVRSLVENEDDRCFASVFVEEFPLCPQQCSGCPSCRNNGFESYYSDTEIRTDFGSTPLPNRFQMPGYDVFSNYIANRQSMQLVYPELENDITECIASLIRHDIPIVIVPAIDDSEKLLDRLSTITKTKYMILSLDEAETIETVWLEGILALLYIGGKEKFLRLYELSQYILKKHPETHIIHVTPNNINISTEMKQLSELVDVNVTASLLE